MKFFHSDTMVKIKKSSSKKFVMISKFGDFKSLDRLFYRDHFFLFLTPNLKWAEIEKVTQVIVNDLCKNYLSQFRLFLKLTVNFFPLTVFSCSWALFPHPITPPRQSSAILSPSLSSISVISSVFTRLKGLDCLLRFFSGFLIGVKAVSVLLSSSELSRLRFLTTLKDLLNLKFL